MSDFHAASVTDNPAITYAFVFTAVTLPVLDRTEGLFAEQTIWFRLKGSVVYGFGLGDLTIRPASYSIRRHQLNRNRTPVFFFYTFIKIVHNFVFSSLE